MNIMKMELAASGMSEEEILAKAQLLMKAFGKEDTASTAEYKLLSKQKNKALVKAEIPPKDFSAVSISLFYLFSTLGWIRLFTPLSLVLVPRFCRHSDSFSHPISKRF